MSVNSSDSEINAIPLLKDFKSIDGFNKDEFVTEVMVDIAKNQHLQCLTEKDEEIATLQQVLINEQKHALEMKKENERLEEANRSVREKEDKIRFLEQKLLTEERRKNEELTFILIGPVAVGKSSIGNTILGKTIFKTGTSSNPTTTEIKVASCVHDGYPITVFDTPGFESRRLMSNFKRQSSILTEQLKFRDTNGCFYLFVLGIDSCQPTEISGLHDILKTYKDICEKTIIIFTHWPKGVEVKEYLGYNSKLSDIIRTFNLLYITFDDKYGFDNDNPTELKTLFDHAVKSKLNDCQVKFQQYTSEV